MSLEVGSQMQGVEGRQEPLKDASPSPSEMCWGDTPSWCSKA